MPKLKAHNEAFTAKKEVADKAKADIKAKDDELLKNKRELKRMHQDVKAKLKKLKGTVSDLDI